MKVMDVLNGPGLPPLLRLRTSKLAMEQLDIDGFKLDTEHARARADGTRSMACKDLTITDLTRLYDAASSNEITIGTVKRLDPSSPERYRLFDYFGSLQYAISSKGLRSQ